MSESNRLILAGLFEREHPATILRPQNFEILDALRSCSEIRLAMAFSRLTGWSLLEKGILRSRGDVFLLTGLDFMQTQPSLLREWYELGRGDRRFQPRLMRHGSGTFHPKVIIGTCRENSFAIVGSGNLSEGGLKTNVECGLLTRDKKEVSLLVEWFDELFRQADPFGGTDIAIYEEKYKRVRRAVRQIEREQKIANHEIGLNQRATRRRVENVRLSMGMNYRGRRMPLNERRLKNILREGWRMKSADYVSGTETNNVKTFFFFCQRLIHEPPDIELSSRALNDHIRSKLRGLLKDRQNPHGWFGAAWTKWIKRPAFKHFKKEYRYVLRRSDRPYSYSINPDYIPMVGRIFAGFRDRR
jgi:HKD family nuclease